MCLRTSLRRMSSGRTGSLPKDEESFAGGVGGGAVLCAAASRSFWRRCLLVPLTLNSVKSFLFYRLHIKVCPAENGKQEAPHVKLGRIPLLLRKQQNPIKACQTDWRSLNLRAKGISVHSVFFVKVQLECPFVTECDMYNMLERTSV